MHLLFESKTQKTLKYAIFLPALFFNFVTYQSSWRLYLNNLIILLFEINKLLSAISAAFF